MFYLLWVFLILLFYNTIVKLWVKIQKILILVLNYPKIFIFSNIHEMTINLKTCSFDYLSIELYTRVTIIIGSATLGPNQNLPYHHEQCPLFDIIIQLDLIH